MRVSIMGMSGTGKTSAIRELALGAHQAYDPRYAGMVALGRRRGSGHADVC
jgi:hypothetical protein